MAEGLEKTPDARLMRGEMGEAADRFRARLQPEVIEWSLSDL